MLNIEDIIVKAILSCTQSIVSACRMFVNHFNNCFELFGFDILIDDTLKVIFKISNLNLPKFKI
jgi:tubulin polyglutamylase TTLL5